MKARALVLVTTLLAGPGGAGAEVCIVNGSDQTFRFTAETQAGQRATADLGPGHRLCVGAPQDIAGTVGVFRSADAIEGCSRLVRSGSQTLLSYFDFDRCHWTPDPE